jgi:hypothetical protein
MKRDRLTKTTTDLLPISAVEKVLPPLMSQMTVSEASLPRHVLPKDLPTAIRQLDDQEFERLVVAVSVEQKRRGQKQHVSNQAQSAEGAPRSLKPGQTNAVRAAFKAGVKPPQIARQFGISPSAVREALGLKR